MVDERLLQMHSNAQRLSLHIAVLIGFALTACYGSIPALCDDNYCADGSVDAIAETGAETSVGDAAADVVGETAIDTGTVDATDGGGGCLAPTILSCNGVCVNPTLPQSCGGCGNVCPAPDAGTGEATCTAGACGLGCEAPTTLSCSGACVDPSQPAHCGSCTNTCPGPTIGTGAALCTLGDGGGTCSVTCSGTTTETCGGACYSPLDTNHCGACDNACPAPPSGNGQATCTGTSPVCSVSCSAGYHMCSADCLPNTDEPSDLGDPCILTETFGVFVAPTGSDTAGSGFVWLPTRRSGVRWMRRKRRR